MKQIKKYMRTYEKNQKQIIQNLLNSIIIIIHFNRSFFIVLLTFLLLFLQYQQQNSINIFNMLTPVHHQISRDGFSSDQEHKQQESNSPNKRTVESPSKHRDDIKYKLPPAYQLRNKALYSLRPDIQTGWVPNILFHNPLPLIFRNAIVDKIVQQILVRKTQPSFEVSYLGIRYQNTFYLHYGKSYPFPYNHINKPTTFNFTNRAFLGNNKSVDGLKFDSIFQSGNLDCAIKISQTEYDLFMLVDTNTKGHMQWYNFKVKNAQKGKKYTFNICNFEKSKSLYSRGMKPYIFSKMKQLTKVGWEQSGTNLKFDKEPLRYTFLSQKSQNKYHRLSFEYIFQYDDDEIQIAYCVPYEYSYLLKYIDELVARSKKLNYSFLKVSKLSHSLSGLDVPLLTIHEDDEQGISCNTSIKNKQIASKLNLYEQKIQKKCIIISGRAHPGQSNGSFMMQGFLDFICGNSSYASYLRKRIVFKIIPMLNPDGVVSGNYRTGLGGKDFNRQFMKPDRHVFPQIWSLKDLVKKSKREFKNNLLLFLDFHGHSIKKNVFMYGPQFSISGKYYYETKIFPKLISIRTDMFRYYSCIFKVSYSKQTTARAIVLKKLDVPFSYTIQASNGSFYDHKLMKDVPFNTNLWIEVGNQIGLTLFDYCSVLISSEQEKIQKMKQRKKRNLNRKIGRDSYLEKARITKMKPHTLEIRQKQIQDDIDYSKFKSLIDGIKKQEQTRSKIKNNKSESESEDDISEGDSDFEEGDDLDDKIIMKLRKFVKQKKLLQDLNSVKFPPIDETEQYAKSLDYDQKAESESQKLVEKQSLPKIGSKNNRSNSILLKEILYKEPTKELYVQSVKESIQKPTLKVNNLSFLTPNQIREKIISSRYNLGSQKQYKFENYRKKQVIKIENFIPMLENLKSSLGIIKRKQMDRNEHNMTFYTRKFREEDNKILKNSLQKKRSIETKSLQANK